MTDNVNLAANTVEEFIITRDFNAPRDLLWEVWTEPEHVGKWLGPTGTTNSVKSSDFRAGGHLHYCLTGEDGSQLWGKIIYREISPKHRLVYLTTFSDEAGGLGRHPMAPTWPPQMLTTTTFEEANGKTTVTVRWVPIEATPEEVQTFEENRAGMTMGWTGTFDKLDAYLATF